LNFITTYFFNSYNQLKEVGWFRNALYLFVLYRLILFSFYFDELFSSNALIYNHSGNGNLLFNIVYFLNNYYSPLLAFAFIVAAVVFVVIGLFGKSNYITNTLLWFIIINFNAYLYPVLTGGDFLLNQFLLFNILLKPKVSNHAVINQLKIFTHNFGLIALKIQICLAYFLAGYFKLIDESWYSGEAITTTFNVPEYSNYIFKSFPHVFNVALTYLTIIYQLCFPVLVWIRPFKIYLFAFGITQHLLIAFGIGLFSFGIIMVISYILFLKYDNK
jgi:hypothetical protein